MIKLYQQMKDGKWFMHCPCGKNWVAAEKQTLCPLCKRDTELTAKLKKLSVALSRKFNRALREA